MCDNSESKRIHVDLGSLTGMIWLIGWMFTIAFAHLGFWYSVAGIFLWPYYLGMAVR